MKTKAKRRRRGLRPLLAHPVAEAAGKKENLISALLSALLGITLILLAGGQAYRQEPLVSRKYGHVVSVITPTGDAVSYWGTLMGIFLFGLFALSRSIIAWRQYRLLCKPLLSRAERRHALRKKRHTSQS